MAEPVGMTGDDVVRYVALGDSSTEGLCDPDGDGGWIGWSQRLAQRMADAHGEVEWANLAVRGRTARQVLVDQLAPAVALAPTVATVFAGMNDLLRFIRPVDDVLDDLATMHHTLLATGATVVTLTLPDLSEVVRLARPLRGRVRALNAGIRRFADDGVVVVDMAANPMVTDPRLWAEDRLHANAEGHRRIAEALAAALDLPASDWATPIEGPPVTWDRTANRDWRRSHLFPWVGRRLRRTSTGDDLGARHPEPIAVVAGSAQHDDGGQDDDGRDQQPDEEPVGPGTRG